jgi:hypothetical protein
MKRIMTLGFAFAVMLVGMSCNAQPDKKATANNSTTSKVEAYYFHFTSRCVTCQTVESEAKKDLESLYNGKVSFKTVNLDEAEGKALADKLKVSGQTLLVVKGNNQVNITNEGFLYARSNPEKFKLVIKEKVDGLLK